MKKTKLRQNAEAKLSKQKEKTQPLKKIDTLRMVHELQVHQIELEMQNEELAQKRVESEALLRQYSDLYDFVPLGYFTLTRDGMILMSNLTGANLLGVDRKNLVKRRFGVFVSVESRSIFNEFLERVFISGKGDDCEIMLLKDKTDPLWVRLDAFCSENHLDCRIVMKDVTERKHVEEKMLESQKQYQQLVELSPDAIAVHSNGILRFVNQAGVKMLGATKPDELIGRPIFDFIAPSDRPSVIARIHKTLETPEPLSPMAGKFLRVDGSELDAEVVSSPFVFDGQPSLIVFIRDITERKLAEDTMAALSLRTQTLLQTASDGIHILDDQGQVVEVNDAFCRMLGYPREKLLHL